MPTPPGINVRKGAISDMLEESVVQPLLVTSSALSLATEATRLILKIDGAAAVAAGGAGSGRHRQWAAPGLLLPRLLLLLLLLLLLEHLRSPR